MITNPLPLPLKQFLGGFIATFTHSNQGEEREREEKTKKGEANWASQCPTDMRMDWCDAYDTIISNFNQRKTLGKAY